MKTFVLLSILALIVNCATVEEVPRYYPSSGKGCSEYISTNDRLSCISSLVKQLESIQNATIIIERVKMDRIDNTYVNYKSIYCFSDQSGKEKFLCFETIKKEYDPTVLGTILDWTKKMGIGGIIGFASGMYLLQ